MGAALFLQLDSTRVLAQNRMTYSVVSPESGHIALGLAVRKLNVSGTFMQSAAHPDDEHNGLFALYTLGMGLRSIDLQTNRGEGGQNEIGPELFRDIGVLRTSELLAAHRIDGAEQYFTRAIDYGYSFSPQEVIDKWGRDETIGDFVRQIRTFRPDVFLTMNIQGSGGDRAHEATTILATEAYKAAGDPSKYPEQIKEGLRPWKPKKFYYTGGRGVIGGRGVRAVPVGVEDEVVRLRRRLRSGFGGTAAGHQAAPAPAGWPPGAHQHRRVRRASRTHVRRDRQRRAQQSQVPGHRRAAGDSRRAAGRPRRWRAGRRGLRSCRIRRFPDRWTRTRRRSSTAST